MSHSKDLFVSIETLINEKFEEILRCLNARREQLLSELADIHSAYKSKHDSNLKTLEELEKMRTQLENIFIRQNQAAQIHESAVQNIVKERDAIKVKMNEAGLKLNLECDITPILCMIPSLGELVQDELMPPPLPPRSPRVRSASVSPDLYLQKTPQLTARSNSLQSRDASTLPAKLYSNFHGPLPQLPTIPSDKPPLPIRPASYRAKHMPIYSSGNRGSDVGNIDSPLGLVYNPVEEKVYAVDQGSHKVVVFSSDGVFDTEFGHNILRKPHSIAMRDYFCCVSDEELNGIVKFKLTTFTLVKIGLFNKGGGFSELNGPRGIAIDEMHNVYVADSINNRVCILNADLDFVKVFLENFFQLPQDIIMIQEMIYVLDRSTDFTVHSFTKCGNLVQSVVAPGLDVFFPSFLSTDHAGQLFLTDAEVQGVKVFTLDGELCNLVGDQTQRWNPSINGATGVCVIKDGRVVCAFSEGDNALCFY